ncbi:MAG: hypothetical protein QF898_12750, partial [SAR202 cluster bacterium]|nr:hypothetical protein [SAR202 cluster bacterium]
QIDIAGVAPLDQLARYEICLIGDDLPDGFFETIRLRHDLADGVAAGVFPFALGARVADCQNRQFENLFTPCLRNELINAEEEFPNIPCAVTGHSGTLMSVVGYRPVGARFQRVKKLAPDAALKALFTFAIQPIC